MRARFPAVVMIALVLLMAEPARADHEFGMFLGGLGLGLMGPLGGLLLAMPLFAVASATGVEVTPRPTAGVVGGATMLPSLSGRNDGILVAFDMGGYPEGSRLGWEARAELFAFSGHRPDLLHVRWDGLALIALNEWDAAYSVEALLGGTLWPTLDGRGELEWTGGPTVGARLGTWLGAHRLLRIEAEGLYRLLASDHWDGLAGQLELGASATFRIRYRHPGNPKAHDEVGVGLGYRGYVPTGRDRLAPEVHMLLLTLAY